MLSALFLLCLSCGKVPPPEACGPVPEPRQIAWQKLEFYAFVHFNMNTFTNMEWGFGDESPELFNPGELDTRQWARICKEAGMTGIIITAKHHDGFCLWPSDYTEHSVKNSPWKNGEGDVIRDLANACQEYGLKMGIYLSPWDRNHPDYGKPEYIDYFRNQLRELLTEYGDVFEVWFDGANGGTGYYGGANEERRVDKLTYYDWPNTYALIRELQPGAVIFSDAGPDVRWVGNEDGHAYPTTWSTLMRDSVYAGMPEYSGKWSAGQDTGTHWVPAEVNVSIRPGWYYHPYEDHKVKSLPRLMDVYYESLGMNGTFLLNLPVDTRGLVHENDARQLLRLAEQVKKDFAHNLASGAEVAASSTHGRGFEAENLIDGDEEHYWAAAAGHTEATLTLTFPDATRINRFVAREYFPLGQRIKAFTLEAETDAGWKEIASETTVGYQRILRLDEVIATALRMTITDSKCPPTLSEIEAYYAPPMMVPPTVRRNRQGQVRLETPDPETEMYYTLDGSAPSSASLPYSSPFDLKDGAVVKAISYNPASGESSEAEQVVFDVAKSKWQVNGAPEASLRAIDDDPTTWWSAAGKEGSGDIVVDLGENLELSGFTYLPMQERYMRGIIDRYAFYTRTAGGSWTLASQGEFSNIQNSPIEQRVRFAPRNARYFRLRALSTLDDQAPSYAEIGVITGKGGLQ